MTRQLNNDYMEPNYNQLINKSLITKVKHSIKILPSASFFIVLSRFYISIPLPTPKQPTKSQKYRISANIVHKEVVIPKKANTPNLKGYYNLVNGNNSKNQKQYYSFFINNLKYLPFFLYTSTTITYNFYIYLPIKNVSFSLTRLILAGALLSLSPSLINLFSIPQISIDTSYNCPTLSLFFLSLSSFFSLSRNPMTNGRFFQHYNTPTLS